jgi:hypothetical protein
MCIYIIVQCYAPFKITLSVTCNMMYFILYNNELKIILVRKADKYVIT